mmetsp:Transcript_134752/g.300318  ORF Transcript_134752/g.300318 Transcript_134752/m.300318 type:complete len:437 (+) Transcript_134752:104-1414(+)
MLVNVSAKLIIAALAEFERPLSVSALNCSVMYKTAVAQIVNTGLILYVVNHSFPAGVRDMASWIPGNKLFFSGEYDDFMRGWYSSVGVALMMNMLLNTIVPGASEVAKMYVTRLKQHCLGGQQKHQEELLKLYTNPPFDIAVRYAQLLTTVFCTMMYCSGMPILTVFAAVYMVVSYWADKLVLLRGSQRPPAFGGEMPLQAGHLMLWAVPLHCGFGIAMYGQPCTFPSLPLSGPLGSLSSQARSASGQVSNGAMSWIWSRITVESTWLLALLLILSLALWVIWNVLWILGGTLGELWTVCRTACCGGGLKVAPLCEDEQLDWDTAYNRMERLYPPASYRLERSPQFAPLAHYLSGLGSSGGEPGSALDSVSEGFEKAEHNEPVIVQATPKGTPKESPAESRAASPPASPAAPEPSTAESETGNAMTAVVPSEAAAP